MIQLLEGVQPYREEDIKKYIDKRWWRGVTLGDILDRAADMHPDKEAFVDRTSRYTYGQAREKTDKLALGLMRLGIQPLDRVLIQLPNWNEFVFAFFACQKIGAITVLLIERYRQFEIDRLIKLTGATAWIVPKNTKKIDFMPIVNDVLHDHPEVNKIITVRASVDQPGFYSLETLIDESELTPENLAELVKRNPDPMQVAHMGPTGGTTGSPKIVPRLHNSLVCGVESCSMSWDQHCEDVNLIAGTIGHDLSFTKGFLGTVITQGKVIFQSKLDNESICKTIEREKVTSIIWVPTLAKRMVQYDDLDKYDLSSLRKMHSAGGASHPDLVKDVIDKLNMKFYNGYGGTEGMTCITRTVDDYNTICCTVGRPTFPHDQYKVVDAFGKEVPPGQQGELLVKGPCVFSGYLNDPEENAKVFDQDGYFKTGDLARVDKKGYISLTGRIKEMINRGGESISSTEIEKLVSRHPDVAAVAVVPMPDPMMGERVCAYIEPKVGIRLTFDDIITFLKNQKASVLHLPERIEFLDKMPLTATDKLNKQALRNDIEDKLSKEVIA
jgi:2,3-dihydroxybenzoate-AMP ligase/mycobactin salicyl-AMP ligase